MIDLHAVGDRVRRRREQLGLTQRDIAVSLQMSSQAVSKWERGENAPDVSMLVALSRLLGVSTDWLLGSYGEENDVIEATVFLADVVGFTARSESMHPRDAAAWLNGQLYQLTEVVLRHDGVVVKYVGDMAVCFFAGPSHQDRAMQSAIAATGLTPGLLRIGLHSGPIYTCTIGHPAYAAREILGRTVNITDFTVEWVRRVPSFVVATETVVQGLQQTYPLDRHEEVTLGKEALVTTMYALRA